MGYALLQHLVAELAGLCGSLPLSPLLYGGINVNTPTEQHQQSCSLPDDVWVRVGVERDGTGGAYCRWCVSLTFSRFAADETETVLADFSYDAQVAQPDDIAMPDATKAAVRATLKHLYPPPPPRELVRKRRLVFL